MIEGVKIEVSSSELEDHLAERANHHHDKHEFYTKQVQSLKDGGIRDNPGVSNDPIASLEHSAKSHKEKAGLFGFLVDHVIPNEVYRLSENDLTRLEIVSRYF